MQRDNNRNEDEGILQDKTCNKCIEKITHLKKLIEIEEEKLFKAMRKADKKWFNTLPTVS